MKQFFSFFAVFMLFAVFAPATLSQEINYDFSSVAPSGQTLYYRIVDGNAEVTYPSYLHDGDYYYYFYYNVSEPVGDLVIPSTVTYNGITYSVTSIGSCAFLSSFPDYADSPRYGCALTSVTIPNSVTTIGSQAFAGCSGLTSVYYTGDVAGWCGIEFNCNPLWYAHNLYINNALVTNLVIPSGVTEIKYAAFEDATCLTSVTIGNSVTSIGNYSFLGCFGLSSLTIGNSVTSIGVHAFSGCPGLTEIHSLNNVAPLLVESFESYNDYYVGANYEAVPSTIPVYIPCGASGSYYGRWSYFSNFIESDAFTFSAVSADNNMGTVQILTMPTCTNPQAVVYASANSGYQFDHWSDGSTANPYSLTVNEDMELTAYFVSAGGGSQGIDDITSTDDIKIHTRGNKIVIETTDALTHSGNQAIIVYDVMGRIIHTNPSTQSPTNTIEIPVPTTGLYMVKVADQPSRKVLVRP